MFLDLLIYEQFKYYSKYILILNLDNEFVLIIVVMNELGTTKELDLLLILISCIGYRFSLVSLINFN